MSNIQDSETQSFEFERGKPGVINVNAPCRFVLETAIGSVIEGLITPNNPLTITSQGDIIKVNINVEEGSLEKPSGVET